MTPDALAQLIVGTVKQALADPKQRIARLEQQQQTLTDELRRVRDQLVEVQATTAARDRDSVR
jgi:small-conductance mechanosensitive channel